MTIVYSASLFNEKTGHIDQKMEEAEAAYDDQDLDLKEFLSARWPKQPARLQRPISARDAMLKVS